MAAAGKPALRSASAASASPLSVQLAGMESTGGWVPPGGPPGGQAAAATWAQSISLNGTMPVTALSALSLPTFAASFTPAQASLQNVPA
jgi:hypothetical protein